jgi:hypothetical protein
VGHKFHDGRVIHGLLFIICRLFISIVAIRMRLSRADIDYFSDLLSKSLCQLMVLVCCIYAIGMLPNVALMSKMKKFFIQFINKMNKELLEEKEPVRQKKLTRSVKTDKNDPKKTDKVDPKKTDKVDPKKTDKTEPKKTDKVEPKKTDKTEPKKTDKTEPKEKHKFPLTRAPSKSLVSMYVSKENQELLWASIRGRR